MSFLCQFCGKRLSNKQSYSRHWRTIHFGYNEMLKCSLCEKEFRRKDNLQNHIIRKHIEETKEYFRQKCEFCHKTVDKQKYKRHLMLMHRPVVDKEDDRPRVNCSLCNVSFVCKSSLRNHTIKVHKLVSEKNITIKCPMCNYKTETGSTKLIYAHFQNKHSISMKFENYHFQSLDDFYKWKRNLEIKTVSSFRSNRKESNFLKFKCHRSGSYKHLNVKRNLRVTGSCKINGFCPAFISAKIINSNNISVIYQKTHVGHKNELRHIPLTPDERKAIAILLAVNIPIDEILKRIRRSLTNAPLQRIHLTNRKDIHNIKKSFDLGAIAAEYSNEFKTEFKNFDDATLEKLFKFVPVANEHSVEVENVKPVSVDSYPVPVDNKRIPVVDCKPVPVDCKPIPVDCKPVPVDCKPIPVDCKPVPVDCKPVRVPEETPTAPNFGLSDDEDGLSVDLNAMSDEEPIEEQGSTNALDSSIEIQLEKWVTDLKKSENTALAVYKPCGRLDPEIPLLDKSDFLLIFMTRAQKDILIQDSKDIVCIEGSDCHNLRLFTLLTPDETREGFPVAFMFTNRDDELVMSIFLDKILEVVGYIKPIVVMTNMEESFYLSWETIMGETKLHLYSTWHVLNVWRENINSKIKFKQKQNDVYKILQNILYELDESKFHNMLKGYLLYWRKDKDMIPFLDYFRSSFLDENQCKKWAYCYRVNIGTNINISIDIFNSVLNCFNRRGGKMLIKSPDDKLFDVLNLLRDKLFELITKINKGKLEIKLQNLRHRHGFSYANDKEYVIQDEDKWKVVNYINNEVNEIQTVKKVKECNNCLLQCFQCHSCFHEYVCSCADHLVKNNMCKHIHFVARTQKLIESNPDGADSDNSLEISTPDEVCVITKDLILKM